MAEKPKVWEHAGWIPPSSLYSFPFIPLSLSGPLTEVIVLHPVEKGRAVVALWGWFWGTVSECVHCQIRWAPSFDGSVGIAHRPLFSRPPYWDRLHLLLLLSPVAFHPSCVLFTLSKMCYFCVCLLLTSHLNVASYWSSLYWEVLCSLLSFPCYSGVAYKVATVITTFRLVYIQQSV